MANVCESCVHALPRCFDCTRNFVIELSDDEGAAIAVPNPARGGQRVDTEKVARRCRTKTRPLSAAPTQKKPSSQTCRFLKRSSRNIDEPILGPSRVVKRSASATRHGEAYVVNARGLYIVGQTSRATDNYLANVERVADMINANEVTTIREARDLLRK